MVDSPIDKVNEKTWKQIYDKNNVQQHQNQTKIFYLKFIPRSTKSLILSDSTNKKYKQKIWAQIQLYTPILQQNFKIYLIL